MTLTTFGVHLLLQDRISIDCIDYRANGINPEIMESDISDKTVLQISEELTKAIIEHGNKHGHITMLRAFLRQYEKHRVRLKEKKKDMELAMKAVINFGRT